MAQRVQVLYVCDVHGDDSTAGSDTVTFALDGTTYEIDVCDQHARELRDAFAPYVGHARRVGSGRGAGRPRGGRTRGGGGGGGRSNTAEIRRWAREQGHQVPERGRLPASIVDAYEQAH